MQRSRSLWHTLYPFISVRVICQATAIASFILIAYSLFLPWWHLDTVIGSIRSPVWVAGNIITNQIQTANWHFIFPLFLTAFITLLSPYLEKKISTILFVWAAILLPLQIEASRNYFLNYYLENPPNPTESLGVAGPFSSTLQV